MRALALLVVFVVSAALVSSCTAGSTRPNPPSTGAATSSSSNPSPQPPAPIFAIYYLWWDRSHWLSHLGPRYPVTAAPPPLPATLDASGCSTAERFPGNVVTDVSPQLAYDQSDPRTIQRDVELAAGAGLRGFVVNWIGTGAAQQTATSSDFNKRLAYVFDAVHRINASGRHFSVVLNYQSSAKKRTTAQFAADFGYFLSAYGHDPALDHSFSPLPEVVMAGTWKYSDAELGVISKAFRSRMYLIGDEKPASWDQARAEYLDGTSYYWSSQNPIKNPSSFATLQQFAATVRSTRNPDGSAKTWLAPFTPGYNASLLYHTPTCVPRDDGRTMHSLFDGNSASHPDGWTLISWNEITEGTYIVPLQRYGMRYVDVLRSITGG